MLADNFLLSTIPANQLLEIIKQAVRDELNNTSYSDIPQPRPSKLITTKELCEFLGVTEPTVIKGRSKGKIPFIEIGTAVRFNLTDVLSALEARPGKKKNKIHG